MPSALPSSREVSLTAEPTPCFSGGSDETIAVVAGVLARPMPAANSTRPIARCQYVNTEFCCQASGGRRWARARDRAGGLGRAGRERRSSPPPAGSSRIWATTARRCARSPSKPGSTRRSSATSTAPSSSFLAVVELPFRPAEVLPDLLAGDRGQVGLRLARFALSTLESERGRGRVLGLVRAATSEPEAARLIRELLTRELLTLRRRASAPTTRSLARDS